MSGCFSLSLSSPRMRSLVFVFFWRVAWETAGSGGMKLNEKMGSWPVSFEMYWRFGMNSKQIGAFDQHKKRL